MWSHNLFLIMYSTLFEGKSLKGMKMGQRKGKKPRQKQIRRGTVQNCYYSIVYYFFVSIVPVLLLCYFC